MLPIVSQLTSNILTINYTANLLTLIHQKYVLPCSSLYSGRRVTSIETHEWQISVLWAYAIARTEMDKATSSYQININFSNVTVIILLSRAIYNKLFLKVYKNGS